MFDKTKQEPYFDDYDSSKQYSQILAVPGRVEQAREFTQIQTMLFDFLKRVSDTILKDGSIVAGMGFSIKDNTLTIEDGKVYIEGKVHEFKQQSIEITKTGTEIIGLKVDYYIVTEEQDSSLLDPAQNMQNYGQPGAHRVKAVPVLTLNESEAAVLYEFEDGELKVEVAKPSLDGITEVLARRTYDESGNYRVRGLELFAEPYDADNIQLVVEAGTAYVLGYEITKPTPVKKRIPISKDLKATLNEPKTYVSNNQKYVLNNFPAKEINKLVAQVEVTQTITRGSVVGGVDYLPKQPVVSIQSVKQGTKTYVQGTDYQLSADGVDWSLDGAEPEVGSSYEVVYRYNKEMVQGTDYKLLQETGRWGETKDYVQFLSGDKPVPNTQFTVDYKFFLARKDLISLDKNGNVVVTPGQPDIERLAVVPTVTSEEYLNLGYVVLPPNSGNAQAYSASITRLEMGDLQRMLKRLEDVEFNQAITALDQEAISGEPPSELIGVFSDGFKSTTRGDLTHPEFDVMYSLEDGLIMLPIVNTNDTSPTINEGESNAKVWGRVISAPMREITAINQQYATTTMKINPYLAFNTLGVLKLSPEVDNWIETEKIKIEETQFKARNFYRWWTHADGRQKKMADIWDLQIDGKKQTVGDLRLKIGEQATAIKTEKSKTVVEEAITYMRQIDVTIDASNLSPASDNLTCYFDGVKVALTPLSGFSKGTTPGTVRSNASGRVKAKFKIPEGIRTGTREVVLTNESNTASAGFTSIGTKRTTTEKVLRTRITLTAVDPLAQTFQFDEAKILTSVSAYFAAKDNTNNVQVQIRNVVNGYPGNVVYGEKVLAPSEIKVSEDATAETKVTFDDPIMCEAGQQYCVVYMTDSADHSLYVADLGKTDITTGQTITRQPYLAGLLFSSKNAIAWTAHQSMNMKFKVYVAEFEPTGTVEFDPIFNMESDRLLLLSDELTPQNTGCIWDMKLDDGEFRPIASYQDVELEAVIDKVQLRATFKSDKNMSPLMAADSFTLVGFLQATSGSYISRNTTLLEPYTNVKIVYDGFIPSGCTITPQFSYDDGKTWITPPQTSAVEVELNWTRYTHTKSVEASANAKMFRVRLNIQAASSVVRPKVRKLMCVMN